MARAAAVGPRRRVAAAGLLLLAAVAGFAAWRYSQAPPQYFRSPELDRVAQPLRRIDLDVPEGREGVDYYGTLRMEVFIDHRGRVERVELLESTVPQAFRDRAVRAFTEARFEPAVKGGRAVRSVKKIEVVFPPPVRGLEGSMSGTGR